MILKACRACNPCLGVETCKRTSWGRGGGGSTVCLANSSTNERLLQKEGTRLPRNGCMRLSSGVYNVHKYLHNTPAHTQAPACTENEKNYHEHS